MKKIYLLFIICASIIFQACVDMDDCSVNEEIATQVFIVNSGFTTISSSDLLNETYRVYVYKAGYNKESVEVNLKADETILFDYNVQNETSYVILPSSYYSLGNSVNLNTSNYSGYITLIFDTEAIENSISENEYVLPLVISGVSAEKTSQENHILIRYIK